MKYRNKQSLKQQKKYRRFNIDSNSDSKKEHPPHHTAQNRVRFLALLLSAVLLLSGCPVWVFAETTVLDTMTDVVPSSEHDTVMEELQEIIEETPAGGIAEVTSLREENVKHFRLTDGTYQAVVYPEAVHRRDADGTWQDIDNTLYLQASAQSLTADSAVYTTSDARIRFASVAQVNQPLLTLRENGYVVSLTLLQSGGNVSLYALDASSVATGRVKNTSAAPAASDRVWASLEEATRIDHYASVTYANILSGVDLEYILQGNSVKENILVRTRADQYVYTFRLQADGLDAVLTDDGNILLSDSTTGIVRYDLPAPYMYDAAQTLSHAVSYQLTRESGGSYRLTVTADADWINSTERVFPVTIDPSIRPSDTFADTYISSSAKDTNYGSSEKLWVSSGRTTFLKTTMPALPQNATITYAMLSIPYYYNIDTGSLTAGAYQVTEDWTEYGLTWNTANAHTNLGISTTRLDTAPLYADEFCTETTPSTALFTITDAVSAWYDDPYSNYGIAIKYESGTNASVILKSSETANKPSMQINYTYSIPDGVYAILNGYSTGRYLTVENGSPWANNHMQQQQPTTGKAPTVDFNRPFLFKISRVTDTDRYIIRLMTNNNMGFGISGTEVITKELPSDDSDVAASDTFSITWKDGQGFLLVPYGSTKAITMTDTSTANLTVCEKSAVNVKAIWNLIQYTGSHRSGSVTYRGGKLEPGNTITLTPTAYSTRINTNTVNMYIDAGNASDATGTWNANTNKLTIRLIQAAKVKYHVKILSGSTIVHGFYGHIIVVLPLSGSELEYNPEIWNCCSTIQNNTNCYMYALNTQIHPVTNKVEFINPGQIGDPEGSYILPYWDESYVDYLLQGVAKDGEELNFYSIEKYDTCPTGSYKVALVAGFNSQTRAFGYHWYRQDADGYWSHKHGAGEVTRLDGADNLILDPKFANRKEGIFDYSIFVGFYCVKPLNTMKAHTCTSNIND